MALEFCKATEPVGFSPTGETLSSFFLFVAFLRQHLAVLPSWDDFELPDTRDPFTSASQVAEPTDLCHCNQLSFYDLLMYKNGTALAELGPVPVPLFQHGVKRASCGDLSLLLA